MADHDLALALSLQDEFSVLDNGKWTSSSEKRKRPTSIVDDCWETIDPTPDIRDLFLQFNDLYFQGKLSCCEVKWAPRMTLCAGVCCYEGRGGLCSIKLSMPLLKLRPRKDLVQTLLHEMIHAYLFVTHNNKDHDSHGPEFHKHMHRINKQTGANITVYHSFHDEVDLYRQHWWRCDGPCQKRPPYYGMVRRAMNRAPAPRDPWWPEHQRSCGGTYHKVREPEDYGKKRQKKVDDAPSTNKSNDGLKGTPKIYDLLKKDGGGKINTISNGDSFAGSKLNSGSLSTKNGTKISGLWREENDDNSGKENDVQKINYAFTPFTGKGHILGSSKDETVTNSVKRQAVPKGKSFSTGSSVEDRRFPVPDFANLSSKSNRFNEKIISSESRSKAIDIDENDFVNDPGISIRKNVRIERSNFRAKVIAKSGSAAGSKSEELNKGREDMVHSGDQLTILDAFKNVGEKKVPLVVIGESKSEHGNMVPCPVCLVKYNESQINAHLDACLI